MPGDLRIGGDVHVQMTNTERPDGSAAPDATLSVLYGR